MKAFARPRDDPSEKNQIEEYLDEVYGGGHTAELTTEGNFVVKRNGDPVVGFKILYMRDQSEDVPASDPNRDQS
ncbi:hypothetical protein BGZ80_007797 [Entomortierella chlamydospora]|uniref:Uncharacterized protein n=1 Tax=Entomortierella chlamydospora TaxID=101097 RepID=A0A9P6SRU8_9FUNG|nr:hypothetical protein BGZ80_007797 [Entomortierella chlamydospora]